MTRPDTATSTVLRCAVDLVHVPDVADAVEGFGDRYLGRVFTPTEVADCTSATGLRTSSLAARFAAKEAAIKLLRVPDLAAPWQEVEVVTERGGWPTLRLHGQVRELADQRGLHDLDVSLSHDAGYAVAMVTAHQTTRTDGPGAIRTIDEHDET